MSRKLSFFKLAWLNLSRRALPAAIAVLAIALAVAISGVLLKLYVLSQARFATLAQEGQSVVGAKASGLDILLGSLNLEGPYPDFLPYALFESISRQESVKFEDGAVTHTHQVHGVVPLLYFAQMPGLSGFRVMGTNADFLLRPGGGQGEAQGSLQLAQGRWFAGGDDELVLGSEVARRLDLKVGDQVSLALVNPVAALRGPAESGRTGRPMPSSARADGATAESPSFQVVGVLEPTVKIWDFAAFAPIQRGQHWLGQFDLNPISIWSNNVLHYFLAYHEPGAFAPLQSLINQRTVAQIISVEQEVDRLKELTGLGEQFGFVFTLLVLFMAGACVAAMMTTRFEAMSVQLAILRALGYTKGEIAGTLVLEGAFLGLMACVLGGAVDFALFPWVRDLVGLDFHSFVANPYWQSLKVWGAAMVASVAAVSIPVFRLYRQDVHQSLKGL